MAETRTLKNYASLSDIIKTILVVIGTIVVAASGFSLLKANVLSQVPTTIVAIVWGVSSVVLIFYSLNLMAQIFPTKIYNKIVPYIFIGPAVLIMGWYLLLPTLRSLLLSFMDKTSTHFVWFDNYKFLFTDRSMLVSIRNTLIWLVCGTGFSVLIGLVRAVVARVVIVIVAVRCRRAVDGVLGRQVDDVPAVDVAASQSGHRCGRYLQIYVRGEIRRGGADWSFERGRHAIRL